MKQLVHVLGVFSILLLVGCATQSQTAYDYTQFKEENPLSILVLPPLNDSLDVNAGYSFLSVGDSS